MTRCHRPNALLLDAAYSVVKELLCTQIYEFGGGRTVGADVELAWELRRNWDQRKETGPTGSGGSQCAAICRELLRSLLWEG